MTRTLVGLIAAFVLLAGCSETPDRSSSAPSPAESSTSSPAGSGGPPPSATDPVLDDEARVQLVETAARAAETILSYDHRTLDADHANATSLMTPRFSATFTRIFDMLRAAARAEQASVRAVALEAGLVSATPEQASVLVLVDQTTRSRTDAKRLTAQAPVVTLRWSGDAWLVADVQAAQPVPATEQDPARRAVLDAATAMAEAFLNVSWTTIEADVARVKELAATPFKDDYAGSSAALVTQIRRNRTVQVGRVLVAGLARAEDDEATVVVAAQGTSRNDGSTAKPLEKRYRLQLQLQLVDGVWFTSALELLP